MGVCVCFAPGQPATGQCLALPPGRGREVLYLLCTGSSWKGEVPTAGKPTAPNARCRLSKAGLTRLCLLGPEAAQHPGAWKPCVWISYQLPRWPPQGGAQPCSSLIPPVSTRVLAGGRPFSRCFRNSRGLSHGAFCFPQSGSSRRGSGRQADSAVFWARTH